MPAFTCAERSQLEHLPQTLKHRMLQVEGLLGLFAGRLGPHAPRAAAAVAAVAADMSLGSMASSAAGQPPDAYARAVALSERRTHRIPPPVALGARCWLLFANMGHCMLGKKFTSMPNLTTCELTLQRLTLCT